MKLQYLGDSKDCFKWDYHDYLAQELRYPILNIAFMMTPDDGSNQGETLPRQFRQEVIKFCEHLQGLPVKTVKSIAEVQRLPKVTRANYTIKFHNEKFHNEKELITSKTRKQYFSGFSRTDKQLLFLDPDNGFEPEKSRSEKHVLYDEIASILEQVSEDTVLSVFQHFRRKPFVEDFLQIKKRLEANDVKHEHVTAIYWHSLMFVLIGKSQEVVAPIRIANERYSENYPGIVRCIP